MSAPLDRNLTTKFGTVDYAREELVAELATAFVCTSLGIVPPSAMPIISAIGCKS